LITEKICGKCKQLKSLVDFYKRSAAKDGYAPHCKKCGLEYARTQRANDPEWTRKKKNSSLKFAFGITLDDYEAMAEAQGHICAICRLPKTPLCVDHCHVTGKVRGLLCHDCNKMLGFANDNTDVLSRAIEYLGGQS
jgi:hypothetical protein